MTESPGRSPATRSPTGAFDSYRAPDPDATDGSALLVELSVTFD